MQEIFNYLVTNYPMVTTLLTALGIIRLVVKPLMAIIHSALDYTGNPTYMALADKIEGNKFYKAIVWALDYLFSIKIIKK